MSLAQKCAVGGVRGPFSGREEGAEGPGKMLKAGGVAYDCVSGGQRLFSVAPDGALGSGGSL